MSSKYNHKYLKSRLKHLVRTMRPLAGAQSMRTELLRDEPPETIPSPRQVFNLLAEVRKELRYERRVEAADALVLVAVADGVYYFQHNETREIHAYVLSLGEWEFLRKTPEFLALDPQEATP